MVSGRQNWAFLLVAAFVMGSGVANAEDYLVHSEQLLAKGDIRAAEIELKNAVRDDPQNMAAHYRLARVELDLGNAAAAEYEARAAQVGGYDADHTVPLLAQTYLVQHKFRELLRDFPGTDGSATERASVLVARAYAQIALGKLDDGLTSIDQAQRLAPTSPEPLVARARTLISQKNFAAAEPLINQALSLAPKDIEARITQVHLLRIDGKLPEALALVQEILADAPGYLAVRAERAEILVLQNQDSAAKADIDTVLSIQPRSVSATYLKAVLAVKNKDFNEANTELQKISGALETIPHGYYILALVQLNLRHLDQAEDAAQRFAARFPDDLAGHKLLGLIDLAQQRPADTLGALEKFQSAGTADAVALNILGQAYIQLGKTAEAVAAFDAATKLAPKDPSLQLRLGVSQLRTGNAAGLNDIEQSFELAPSAPAAELLAASELAAGNWDKAQAEIDRLKQAQPDSPVPDTLYASIKTAQFNLDGAQADLTKVVETYPDYLPAKLGLVRVLELQGNFDQAEDTLNKLLAAKPADGLILQRLVPLLLHDGKADAAVEAAERAHTVAPSDRAITAGLVELYIHLGRKDEALALAQQEAGSNDLADVPLILARARAEVAAGLNNDATQTYRRLIKIAPSSLELRRTLVSLLVSSGDIAGARQTINEAMAGSPHNPQLAADLLSIDLKDKGVEAALATAHQLQQNDPNLATGPALDGDVYMAAKQYAKAIDAYATALKQKPSAILAVRLARANLAAEIPDAAIAVLSDWLKDHPADTGVADILASYEITRQRYDDATRHLERVVATDRPDPIALNNLAWLYQRAGDPRARLLAERAYLMAPESSEVADTLGWLLVQQNSAATALGLLEEASSEDTRSLEIQYHLAVALNDTGHKDKAIALLKTLTDDKATFDDKAAAVKLLAEISKS